MSLGMNSVLVVKCLLSPEVAIDIYMPERKPLKIFYFQILACRLPMYDHVFVCS